MNREEEEADEIVKRLKKTKRELEQERMDALEEESYKLMVKHIQEEIDREMVERLTKLFEKEPE